MRLPNGYGSVYKLSGNRRRPWVARITTGYKDNGQPIYAFLGYFENRSDALKCLADYNAIPYNTDKAKMTLRELYDAWRKAKSYQFAEGTLRNYDYKMQSLDHLGNTPVKSLRRGFIQSIIDAEPTPAKRIQTRNLFVALDKYAVEIEAIPHRQTEMLDKITYVTVKEKHIFTHQEVETLWNCDTMCADFILILLYSGMRISELFQVQKADCLQGIFRCGVKTKSGKNRIIPIHDEIKPIVAKYVFADGDLLCPYSQQMFRRHFAQLMKQLGMEHTIHETRHTFRTAFDETDANRVCINLIMGHTSGDIGERVYTHKSIDDLRKEINKISL